MFRDRQDAARQLAEHLAGVELHEPLVLGIPRGGAVTGAALARAIGADFDVVLSRKLRAPHQPELAIGAIGEDGHVVIDETSCKASHVTDDYLACEQHRQLEEIRRRAAMFRAVRPAVSLVDRSVIVTDDGIATGSTMMAALDVARAKKARDVTAAIPVAPADRIEEVRRRCNRIVCVHAPAFFWAVGQFYEDFRPVEDETVVEILREFAVA